MIIDSLNKFTQETIKRYVSSKSIVIDATCGNGNDTLFLAKRAHRGKVYAIDIQAEAIANTQKRCQDFENIHYICDSHGKINTYINEAIDLAIYNLGYLPNSNSELTTTSTSTITALTATLNLLKPNGACLITIYTGHDNHQEEKQILPFIKTLSKYEYNVLKYEFINLIDPPYLIVIEKKLQKKNQN